MSIRAFFIGGAYYMAVESGLVGSVALLLGGPVEHQLFNFSFLNKYCPEVFQRSLVVEGVVDLYFNLVEPDLEIYYFEFVVHNYTTDSTYGVILENSLPEKMRARP